MSALLAVILLLATVIAVFVAIRWRRGLFMALPCLVTLNGIPLTFGKSSIRLDQLVACLLLIPLVAAAIAGTRRIRLDTTSRFLVALLAINILSSALNSPVPVYSMLQCLNLAATWVIYVLVINFLERIEELEAFLACVFWAAIAASAIAIVAFVLALSGVGIGGAEVSTSAAEHMTSAYGAYGTMIEPNILGSFTSAYLVLATVVLVSGTGGQASSVSRKLLRWVVALTATGLVLSFTRAAWLGTIVGMLCFVVLGDVRLRARFGARRIGLALVASAVVVISLLLLPGDTGTLFRFKVANLVNPASQTGIVRLFSYVLAVQQTFQHPLIGCGTFSFAALAAQGSDFQQFENWHHLWIGNYLLLALHDTGVIGLALWIGLLVTAVRRALRVLKAVGPRDAAYAGRVLGLIAALSSFLVAFLSTSGFSLGFSWLLMGVLAAYCRIFEEQRMIS